MGAEQSFRVAAVAFLSAFAFLVVLCLRSESWIVINAYLPADFGEIRVWMPFAYPDRIVHIPRPEVAFVDCALLFRGEKNYSKELRKGKLALKATPYNELDMSCVEIKSRVLPARNPDIGYPIAHAKLVYKDYEFLEEQLAVTFAEENAYCFAVDSSASVQFRRQIYALANCLDNVVLSEKEYRTDSGGHFHNHAQLDCIRQLRKLQWNYVILLQNHDIVLKTHAEIAAIFTLMNGTSDIEVASCPSSRCPSKFEQNLGRLMICPKHLTGQKLDECRNGTLQYGKGMTQVSLSRVDVDYILDDLNITVLLNNFNSLSYGVDEMLMHSIGATELLGLPGGFTHRCLSKTNRFITRFTVWAGSRNACSSGRWRHSICILGIEDLPKLLDAPQIMANKMLPSDDYAAISCMAEMLANRTAGRSKKPLDSQFYLNLQAVRYNRMKKQDTGFNVSKFDCS